MYPPCFAMPISGSESVYISMSALFVSLPPAFRARKKGRDFMRKFKTAEENRTNYIYYPAEGKAITIKPGQVGDDGKPASEEIITLLHTWDDDQVDADRRELWQHRTTSKRSLPGSFSWKSIGFPYCICPQERTNSSRQARPVSQDQIR